MPFFMMFFLTGFLALGAIGAMFIVGDIAAACVPIVFLPIVWMLIQGLFMWIKGIVIEKETGYRWDETLVITKHNATTYHKKLMPGDTPGSEQFAPFLFSVILVGLCIVGVVYTFIAQGGIK